MLRRPIVGVVFQQALLVIYREDSEQPGSKVGITSTGVGVVQSQAESLVFDCVLKD